MKKVPVFYCHKDNRGTYNNLYLLRNTDGRRALSTHCLRIAEYISSFPKENGCYARDGLINAFTCDTSMKTFGRNLGYLREIGAITESMEATPVTGENRRVLRLGTPCETPIPQKVYRFNIGIPSYAYLAKQNAVPAKSSADIVDPFPLEALSKCVVGGLRPASSSSTKTLLCVDLGRVKDPTAIIIGDRDGTLLLAESFPLGMDWDMQADYLKEMADKFNSICVFETNGTPRDGVVALFRRRLAPHPVYDVKMNRGTKNQLIANASSAVSNGAIRIPSSISSVPNGQPHYMFSELCRQLCAMKHNPDTDSFCSRIHDDYVAAFTLYVNSLNRLAEAAEMEDEMKESKPVFSSDKAEKTSIDGEHKAEKTSSVEELFAHVRRERRNLEEEKENYPPKPPSRNAVEPEDQMLPWDFGTLRSREAGQTAGLPDRSASPRGGGEIGFEMSKKKTPERTEEPIDDAWGEPLDGAKRKKRQKGPERRAEAAKLRNAGHVVSPLGRVENRGRRLKPDLAGDIGEIGEPTEAQLYKFLTRKFDENGWSDVLAAELPAFRESFSKNLDELRQKFIDGCSYRPTNREIYEYFSWYMEPKRLAKMLSSSSRLPHASWYQIKGQAYVRQFYDQVLFKRHKRHAPQGDEVSAGQVAQDYVREAYDSIRRAQENDDEKVMAMGQYGFVVYAQFLLDTHEITGSECKDRIIGLLVKFSRKIPNKAFAREFLDKMHKATIENHEINDLCEVWGDWAETIKDFASTAMEQAERAT